MYNCKCCGSKISRKIVIQRKPDEENFVCPLCYCKYYPNETENLIRRFRHEHGDEKNARRLECIIEKIF